MFQVDKDKHDGDDNNNNLNQRKHVKTEFVRFLLNFRKNIFNWLLIFSSFSHYSLICA